jgi:dTDP-4-amino-4,6-dideoxygalactose transaminase
VRGTFLGVSRPDLRDEEIAEILDTVRSGWLAAGPKVVRFQDELAAFVGGEHVRALNSCTAGLLLALRLLGIGGDDEVLVPANTFVACANAIEFAGARPVLVDSESGTGLLDFDHAASLVGPRTSALLAVHLGGRPLDADRLASFGARHGLAIVEDAAHALGAAWRGRRVGSWGNLCAFSFHASKNITTFEGGALVGRSAADAERVERLALHGLSRSAWKRHASDAPDHYDVIEPGFKFGMHDVSAAVGIHQLARLDAWIDEREHLARRYDEGLSGLPLEFAPPLPAHARHARHLYNVLVSPGAGAQRDELITELGRRKIGSTVHFHGIHLKSFYRQKYELRPEDLPVATDWAHRSITLPLHPQMTTDDVDDVCAAFGGALLEVRDAA